jgi:hypothetical protein
MVKRKSQFLAPNARPAADAPAFISTGRLLPNGLGADSGDGGQAFHLKADSESGRTRTAIR